MTGACKSRVITSTRDNPDASHAQSGEPRHGRRAMRECVSVTWKRRDICSRYGLYGRSEYLHPTSPPAVNPDSLEARAYWPSRHFSGFNDNGIMMITPLDYLHWTAVLLSLSLSLFRAISPSRSFCSFLPLSSSLSLSHSAQLS